MRQKIFLATILALEHNLGLVFAQNGFVPAFLSLDSLQDQVFEVG
jgi:hypothetical protein